MQLCPKGGCACEIVNRKLNLVSTLFWASTDLRASVDFVEGWRALAGGGIEVHEIPGSHLDIVKEPHVQELAKKLSGCLERAQTLQDQER